MRLQRKNPKPIVHCLRLGALIATSLTGVVAGVQAGTAAPLLAPGVSPALCEPDDIREPGIQGEVPAGKTPNYNCGVKLVGQLAVAGNVAGTGECVYVRSRNQDRMSDESQIHVIDVSNPARPSIVGSPLSVTNNAETLRVAVTPERAVMVSGSQIFDISDCLEPRLLGEINWPDTTIPGVSRKNLPHDIRLNREGTRVYSSFGVWEVDISKLDDPLSWTITDHRCDVAAQVPGPWQEVHRQSLEAGVSLCNDATRPAPRGANYAMGGSPLQASLLWPQVSHTPDFNADDTRLYIADQAGGTSANWAPEPRMRIIDLTRNPLRIIGEVDGPGHGLDWFRTAGREYVLHSNEGGTKGIATQSEAGDTCQPHPRPSALGWGFEAIISDVTDPAQAKNVSMVELAINMPEFCDVRKASGRDPWLAYHLIDNPMNARFAALNFGEAGLRIFDIRDPHNPTEVAYFNHGTPGHGMVGYYDATRKLLYFSDAGGFKVLEFSAEVSKKLGL